MKFATRFSVAIFCAGLLGVGGMVVWSKASLETRATDAARAQVRVEAGHLANSIEITLRELERRISTLGHSPSVLSALSASNAEYASLADPALRVKALNIEWLADSGGTGQLVHERTHNPLASYLKAHQDANPGDYGEIFVTNRHGAMIASTGQLSTLAHAHKYWWRAAWQAGAGRAFIDDRGFDVSVQGFVVGIVVPLWDAGEQVGLIKANLNLQQFLDQLLVDHGDVHPMLVRSNGDIVMEPGKSLLSGRLSALTTAALQSRDQGDFYHGENDTYLGYAPVKVTLGSREFGFGAKHDAIEAIQANLAGVWFVLAEMPADVVHASHLGALRKLLIAGSVLVLLLALIAYVLGKVLARPMTELIEFTYRFGRGKATERLNLNSQVEEVVALEHAFNKMVANLDTTMASRDELVQEVERRRDVENKLRAAKLKSDWNANRLKSTNKELQAFSYSVSHDLRAPLRAINGFAGIVLQRESGRLPAESVDMLERIVAGAERMGVLIDGILMLSRVGRAKLQPERLDFSEIAEAVVTELREAYPDHQPNVTIQPHVSALGDAKLLRVVLDNLLGNAWKFTRKTEHPKITFGVDLKAGVPVYFVRDNGAGFDQKHADKLFGVFQRLHSEKEFPGTGVGLATVMRVISMHNGTISAEGKVGEGACFRFSLNLHEHHVSVAKDD